jgi:HAD superfamily hydrolase (TIGR01484 family)
MIKKLAIFDIDGTIANHGKVPDLVLQGMENLHRLGYFTTVCTGRGYKRMKDALGVGFDTIISDESLISLEHGAKVVTKDGKVVYADYFKDDELDHVLDFIKSNQGLIKYIWFINPDPKHNYQIWCKKETDTEEVKKEKGEYSDVFHCSGQELLGRFKQQQLSSISCKLESHIKVENLKLHFTRSEIDVIFQDGTMDFIRNITDKAKAISKIEEYLSVPKTRLLVAGNAINDVEMLNIEAETRILVGKSENSETILEHLTNKQNITRVSTPESLGQFLLELKD